LTIPREEIASNVLSNLTANELSQGVVYLTKSLIPSGRIDLARINVDVPWQAYIAFVDREPLANWSHSSRYIFVNSETAEIKSVEAEFPPFPASHGIKWDLLYKAPSVSNEAVMNMD
jgi:hypothetical protein